MSVHAIQFSGGKDSLAVMYLSRPLLNVATVYFGDTGAVYPHMVEFVHRTCEDLGAKLKVVSPPMPIRQFHALAGLPSDIVPVEVSAEMLPYIKRQKRPLHLLQSNLRCCNFMLWEPMREAMQRDGVKIIIRGSKAAD